MEGETERGGIGKGEMDAREGGREGRSGKRKGVKV